MPTKLISRFFSCDSARLSSRLETKIPDQFFNIAFKKKYIYLKKSAVLMIC